jgi:hypothetical protein
LKYQKLFIKLSEENQLTLHDHLIVAAERHADDTIEFLSVLGQGSRNLLVAHF